MHLLSRKLPGIWRVALERKTEDRSYHPDRGGSDKAPASEFMSAIRRESHDKSNNGEFCEELTHDEKNSEGVNALVTVSVIITRGVIAFITFCCARI